MRVLYVVFQMVVVSDDVHEYAVALKDTEEKISRCPPRVNPSLSLLHGTRCLCGYCSDCKSLPLQRADILDELQKSQKVFAEKLNHLSRRLAWINATIYSKVCSS